MGNYFYSITNENKFRVHLKFNMKIDRINLTPEYSISNIIKGGWHLAGGHGYISETQAIKDMKAFVEAGVTTFDCADIYTGVENLIGKFRKKYKTAFSSGTSWILFSKGSINLGVTSLGLATTQFPAAIAGAIFHVNK